MTHDESNAQAPEPEESSRTLNEPIFYNPVKGEFCNLPETLPILATPDVVPFRDSTVRIQIRSDAARRVLEHADNGEHLVAVILQKNPSITSPGKGDLHDVGMLGLILKAFPEGDQNASAMFTGIERVVINGELMTDPILQAPVRLAPDVPGASEAELEILFEAVKTAALRLIEISPDIPPEATAMLNEIKGAAALADFLAERMDQPIEAKQKLMAQTDVYQRLNEVGRQVARRIEMMELINKIRGDARSRIDDQQKKYFLREQIESIQKEIGDDDPETRDAARLKERIAAAKLPPGVKEEVDNELARLTSIPQASPEYSLLRGYLDTIASLPWSVETPDHFDLRRARKILDEDHYDLEKIKRRIVEFLAVRRLNPTGRGSILCFVGPPGVGKTSLGKSIARSLGRKFYRLSLGGVRDEADIRGHRRTYIGAFPGRIIEGLRKCGSRNPVMMLDEIDKLSSDFRGDPASALLEVLDPEQNHTFQDHYLSLPFDLSHVIFICTANSVDPIPHALRDRLEIIEIPGYTLSDKLQIAERYLIPQQLVEHGLTAQHCRISIAALKALVEGYTRESGVRNLNRNIAAVMRGVAAKIAETLPPLVLDAPPAAADEKPAANAAGEKPAGDPTPQDKINIPPDAPAFVVQPEDLHSYLGPVQFESELALRASTPGVATGLAYTPVGGDILFVEASRMHGKGRMTITGQIGRVMGESAQAALSLLKSRSDRFNLDPASFSKSDIHIHVPAGAVPKDGPSAGVSMFTALVSLFTGQAVRPDVAMTGEITLRGLVLPIGGVKEKLIAAHRAGIKLALLPKRNEKDVMEIKPPLKGMAVEYVNNVDELIRIAIPSLAPTTKPEIKPAARTTTTAAEPGKLSSIRKNRPNSPMIPPGNA